MLPAETPSDRELIDSVLSGEREDYAELVRRHHAKVMGVCLSMLGDAASAEDAAQDAFLKAYQSLEDFQGDSAFGTWLYRIASNRCLDLLRQRARRAEAPLEAVKDEPRERSDASEEKELVSRVFKRLPEDYRLILTLREIEGLSYTELTEVLDCTLDAVKARLQRARRAFQEELRHIQAPDSV
jgi:RNA polymerase sigma-70 factor (ECF subfamily)